MTFLAAAAGLLAGEGEVALARVGDGDAAGDGEAAGEVALALAGDGDASGEVEVRAVVLLAAVGVATTRAVALVEVMVALAMEPVMLNGLMEVLRPAARGLEFWAVYGEQVRQYLKKYLG